MKYNLPVRIESTDICVFFERFEKTKKPPKGLFGTQCAVGQADDLDKSLFELVA